MGAQRQNQKRLWKLKFAHIVSVSFRSRCFINALPQRMDCRSSVKIAYVNIIVNGLLNKGLLLLPWGGGKQPPFPDADFDNKEPREVLDIMSRAKRWLEERGYNITLRGTYTQVREIKF